MRKIVAFILTFVLLLSACEGKEIPTLQDVQNYTEEDFQISLERVAYEELNKAWGTPEVRLSGFWGDSWFLEEAGRFVTVYYDANGKVENVKLSEREDILEGEFDEAVVEETPIDLIPMVMVDGQLYLDTGKASTADGRCGVMDGEISSSVSSNQKPMKNDQSNFGSGYSYQYGPQEGCIEVCLDKGWYIFATEEVREEIQFPEIPFQLLKNGEEQKPYVHFLSSKQWGGEGWLCGDGKNLAGSLPDIDGELAILVVDDDLELKLGQNAELIRISVLNVSCEVVEEGKDLSILSELPEGNYYLAFLVMEQGDYIAAGEDYESSTRQYIYKLIK